MDRSGWAAHRRARRAGRLFPADSRPSVCRELMRKRRFRHSVRRCGSGMPGSQRPNSGRQVAAPASSSVHLQSGRALRGRRAAPPPTVQLEAFKNGTKPLQFASLAPSSQRMRDHASPVPTISMLDAPLRGGRPSPPSRRRCCSPGPSRSRPTPSGPDDGRQQRHRRRNSGPKITYHMIYAIPLFVK